MESKQHSKIICIQGLGFVGAAMAVAVAASQDPKGQFQYHVYGIDLPNQQGLERINALQQGQFPFTTNDTFLLETLERVIQQGNFEVSTDTTHYAKASVIIVNVPLDIQKEVEPIQADFVPFKKAIQTLGQHVSAGCLIIVETTVPPGTCMHIAKPLLDAELKKRNIDPESVMLAYSYERVMPGKDYLKSITDYWRVYAGINTESAYAAQQFLETIINTKQYPLTELESTTACEMGKVLENSYRATTIAFMEEWGRYAETIGVDLFEVVEAIRLRPTHVNMRTPGFGVGGYCLTKDPLFSEISARDIFSKKDLQFEFCKRAVALNDAMPTVSLNYLTHYLNGLSGKKILLMGVSYRSDIGDTRCSPALAFMQAAKALGATCICHDPLIRMNDDISIELAQEIPALTDIDAVVFGTAHDDYQLIDFEHWFSQHKPFVLDANNVLSNGQRHQLKELEISLFSIGRGLQ